VGRPRGRGAVRAGRRARDHARDEDDDTVVVPNIKKGREQAVAEQIAEAERLDLAPFGSVWSSTASRT
jgi:hypothetical protein